MCLKKLAERDAEQAYITAYDFSQLIEQSGVESINDTFIDSIIAAHHSEPVEVNERQIGFDVWSNILISAGIVRKTAAHTLLVCDNALLDWILDAYAKELHYAKGQINSGCLAYFPIPTLSNPVGDPTPYATEGKAVQAFLFDSVSDDIIQKYIFTGNSFSTMKSTLGLSNDNKGFYTHFSGLEHLIGYSLAGSADTKLRTLGEIIASVELTEIDMAEIAPEELEPATRAKFGSNKIFYGAPGCGKSRHVSDMLKEASVAKDNIIRVTFHPEYANCDFIGQILPTVETRTDETTGEEKEIVKYIFNPGPFTLALQTAYDTNNMVFLIVEEINRGNAAAIFGDMFQLLDRVKDSGKPNYCASEYPVSNPNMQKYLIESISDEAIKAELQNGVFVPSNLTIYATMNSSDQNVFTLDTAFKRRWSFEQISNDINKDTAHAYKTWYVPGTEVTWADFLTKLNDKILDYKLQNQTNEDKRLGKYFVTKDCLVDPANIPGDVSEIAQNFAYKVLEYVWNDVCKIGREEWFDTETYKTLEDLIEAFINPKEGDTPLSVFQNITF